MMERAQTAVVEICQNLRMQSLRRRGRVAHARSDSNLLDLLDKSWFGPQQQAGPAPSAAGFTDHVPPRSHVQHGPIASACAAAPSPRRSTEPRQVSHRPHPDAAAAADGSLVPSVFAMSFSLDRASPPLYASTPPAEPEHAPAAAAPEPHRPTPRSTLTMQIHAEWFEVTDPQAGSSADAAKADGLAGSSCEADATVAHAAADDMLLMPTLALQPFHLEGSKAMHAQVQDSTLWAAATCCSPATTGRTSATTPSHGQPRDLSGTTPSYQPPTSQSLIHPQEQHPQLSMPCISMPLLPILMAKPSIQRLPSDTCIPSLFPVAGSLGASLLFPIAAAAKSMRLRSMQGSESLAGTLPGAALRATSTSAPLLRRPTLAHATGLESPGEAGAAAADAAGSRATREEGKGKQRPDVSPPATGSCSSSGAAAALGRPSQHAAGTDRSCNFWRGLAAASAAVDGNHAPNKNGPRVPEADTIIPWTSPMGNGATATATAGNGSDCN